VLNGTFNAGLAEWRKGGSLPATYQSSPTKLVQLGMPVAQQAQGQGESWLSQTFYVDPNIPQPTLDFWYQIFTNDILDYSDFFVEIQDGVGMNHLATVLRDGFNPPTPVTPDPGKNLGWRIAQYDLSAYAGQHVRLVFHARNLHPNSLGIWVNLDNVRVVSAQDLHDSTIYLPITRR
jgi:hypothetical protein